MHLAIMMYSTGMQFAWENNSCMHLAACTATLRHCRSVSAQSLGDCTLDIVKSSINCEIESQGGWMLFTGLNSNFCSEGMHYSYSTVISTHAFIDTRLQ